MQIRIIYDQGFRDILRPFLYNKKATIRRDTLVILHEIIVLEIVNTLDRGDVTLRNVVRLAKLFSAYLLVLINKYRGLINIF